LHYGRSAHNSTVVADIQYPKADKVTAAQLAIDSEIEQGYVPGISGELQPDSNPPDFPQLKWRLLAGQLAFVPRKARCRLRNVHDWLLRVNGAKSCFAKVVCLRPKAAGKPTAQV